MPYYLASYTGSGTSRDPFLPLGANQPGWNAVDIRSDCTKPGNCLLFLPVDDPNPRLRKISDDKAERLSIGTKDFLNSQLNVALPVESLENTLFSILQTSGKGWNPLRPNARGVFEIILGEKLTRGIQPAQAKEIFIPVAKDFEKKTTSFKKTLFLVSLCAASALFGMPPVFAALPATDDFAGTGALSGNWTAQEILPTFTNSRDSGQAKGDNVAATICASFWSADAFNNNQYSQIVVGFVDPTGGALAYVAPTARAKETGAAFDFYQFTTNGAPGAGQTYLEKYVDGADTALVAAVVGSTAGDTFRIEANGTTITGKKNGVQAAQATDTSLASGSGGIATYDSATNRALLDNFQAGNIRVVKDMLGLSIVPSVRQ